MAETRRRGRGPGGGGPMGGMNSVEKSKDFTGMWKRLLRYINESKVLAIVGIIGAVAGSVLILLGPNILSEITDKIVQGVMGNPDMDGIVSICEKLLFIYLSAFALSFIMRFSYATIAQRVTRKMRNQLQEKTNVLPLKYFDQHSFGDVLSRATNDVDRIGDTLNQSLSSLVMALTSLIGSVIMMLRTDVVMTFSAVGATMIGFVLMMVIIKQSQKYFKLQQNSLGKINGLVEETYSGHAIVRAYNNTTSIKKDFDKINSKLYLSAWKSQFLSGMMMPIMGFIGNFGYVIVCVVGAIRVINGDITMGTIVAFMVYIRLFTNPLSQIAQSANNLQSTAAAAERVFEFLGEEELPTEKDNLEPFNTMNEGVEFEHINFSYAEGKPVIKDFSASVKPGQKVAIVGPTGAGKTTLVNLLMRFYELDSGDIKLDGRSIRDIRRSDLHRQFSMVLQDTWLFNGTIKENITFNVPDVDSETVEEACCVAGLHHFIKTLPNGYDTVIDDNTNISQGQKQLMTIARAIVENAPMLILDEATSSVDTRTEELIQKAMDRLADGRTSFIIAHRLSTIRNADLILVVDNGNIVETGNHDELMAKDGYYADLYNSQFDQVS